jgi:hypothetical protein
VDQSIAKRLRFSVIGSAPGAIMFETMSVPFFPAFNFPALPPPSGLIKPSNRGQQLILFPLYCTCAKEAQKKIYRWTGQLLMFIHVF